jgi:PilZ domain
MHLRTGLGEPGYISSGGACWCCTVINTSAEGAAIELADPTLVPNRFLLMILKNRRVFNCRLAWAQQDRIGVTFEPGPPAQPEKPRSFETEA